MIAIYFVNKLQHVIILPWQLIVITRGKKCASKTKGFSFGFKNNIKICKFKIFRNKII
jgi:hypothetical protein